MSDNQHDYNFAGIPDDGALLSITLVTPDRRLEINISAALLADDLANPDQLPLTHLDPMVEALVGLLKRKQRAADAA